MTEKGPHQLCTQCLAAEASGGRRPSPAQAATSAKNSLRPGQPQHCISQIQDAEGKQHLQSHTGDCGRTRLPFPRGTGLQTDRTPRPSSGLFLLFGGSLLLPLLTPALSPILENPSKGLMCVLIQIVECASFCFEFT